MKVKVSDIESHNAKTFCS